MDYASVVRGEYNFVIFVCLCYLVKSVNPLGEGWGGNFSTKCKFQHQSKLLDRNEYNSEYLVFCLWFWLLSQKDFKISKEEFYSDWIVQFMAT